MNLRGIVIAISIAGAACGGKKSSGAGSGSTASRDAGAAASADLGRCITTLERATKLPAAERAGLLVRGCGLCGRPWDSVLAADHADTGGHVDLEEIWRVVEGCGGVCTNQAAAAFRGQLAELTPGRPSTRPWRALASACGAQLHVDRTSERFVSAAWYALAVIGDQLQLARPTLPASDQARIDSALAAMLLPLPPLTPPGTGYVLPGGGLRPGTPWLQITVTSDAVFVGRLAFAHLSPIGLQLVDGGVPYPGTQLAAPGELAAAIDAQRAPTAPPAPVLADRFAEPVLSAPRGAPARRLLEVVAALGSHRAHLAVAAPAPAALWRGLVAAHPLPLTATAPAGRRLRLGLVTPRIAIVDEAGAVVASAPLPLDDRLLVERWTAALNALAAGHAIEIVAEDGHVGALSMLLDAAAGGAAALAVPAPAKAKLTGNDLATFDEARLKAALAAAAPVPAP